MIVKHWKSSFTGISALHIKDVLGISHDEAIEQLRALEAEGVITVNPCQLGDPSKFNEIKMADVAIQIPTDWEMTDTLMAFPSRTVLDDAFHLDRVDYGEFTNRLHKGASQVQHYYFTRDVLDKYLKHPERYTVEQHATGGGVSMTTEFYLSIPEEDQNTQGFATVRFGHMKLSDRSEAIGVIAKDLDDLPKADQHHWAAHELQNPTLDEDDRAWTEYIEEQFYVSWRADHTDYVKLLRDTLDEINETYGPLFRRTSHPGLHVPGLNTYGEYIAAHKELYKLVGADNLDEDVLKVQLHAHGADEKDFVHESGRPQGKWALLKVLARRRGLDWAPFETVATNRQDDSHRIRERTPRGEYYPARFRDDVANLVRELRKLL